MSNAQELRSAAGGIAECALDGLAGSGGDDDAVFEKQLALLRRHLLSDPR